MSSSLPPPLTTCEGRVAQARHSRGSGSPVVRPWMPACAGMTIRGQSGASIRLSIARLTAKRSLWDQCAARCPQSVPIRLFVARFTNARASVAANIRSHPFIRFSSVAETSPHTSFLFAKLGNSRRTFATRSVSISATSVPGSSGACAITVPHGSTISERP